MKQSLSPLSAQELGKLDEWKAAQGESLPVFVRAVLEHYGALLEGLAGNQRKLRETLHELRRALGLVASSERRTSGDPLGPLSQADGQRPRSKREKLKVRLERFERLAIWHKDIGRRHRRKAKDVKLKLKKLEDVELTAEDLAEVKEGHSEQLTRLKHGDSADNALRTTPEPLMTGAQGTAAERKETAEAEVDMSQGAKLVDTMTEQRERLDFSISVTRLLVDVEKKVVEDPDGRRYVVSGSTAHLGPPNYAVTWGFLAHMAVIVVQYAMPMSRLAKLLSTDAKRFTAGTLARLLRYVARRFAPIYLELVDGLADARILAGDDTSCRVLDVNRHFKSGSEKSPWRDFRTPAEAQQTAAADRQDRLGPTLASELGFEFERRRGGGTKTSLQTTTVSGRSIAEDPSSLTVIYRTHLGGFGNLLQMLLQKRRKNLTQLTVQSDLATVNLVADPKLTELFDIRYAGCASHARRPFALYEHEDPDACAYMLHLFKGLFLNEYGLDLYGRNRQNVLAVRGVDSRAEWLEIKDLAQTMSERWSPQTKLGEGARYIIRNFDKLTAYLEDPYLALSNNFCERMLRLEKLIEAGSMFRATLEGRFALDVMRSVLQTAILAGAPLQDYVESVLRASPIDVAAFPEQYTPRAWVAREGSAAKVVAD